VDHREQQTITVSSRATPQTGRKYHGQQITESGKVVLITGAATGIGRATALAFSTAGLSRITKTSLVGAARGKA
jgi:hypothetical protein